MAEAKRTEKEMNVYEKLMVVQTKIKAPKNLYNSFGKYNYRNAESILESVKPLLAEVKAVLVLEDTVVPIGERYYIKTTCRFIDTVSGQEITTSALAREDAEKKGMDASQLTGSCSSYAHKYCLGAMLLLDDTKDADSDEQKVETDARQGKKAEAKPQVAKMPAQLPKETDKVTEVMVKALVSKAGDDLPGILKMMKVAKAEDLIIKNYSYLMNHWDKAIEVLRKNGN